MITKEQLKSEIERVPDEYIDPLYQIIKALKKSRGKPSDKGWIEFIDNTYGCMRDSPIHRGEQGDFEIRGEIQ